MTSYFKDGGHDVHPPLASSSFRRLPGCPSSACDVSESLIHSIRTYKRIEPWYTDYPL